MRAVALCLTTQHDPCLVIIAVIICLVGSWAALSVLSRVETASGSGRNGWIALTAVATGAMAWSAHFVAMMAYVSRVPIVLDPVLTMLSLLLVILASVPGIALVASRRRWGPAIGGAIVGLGIASMHYIGLIAYRIDGLVQWDWSLVAASIVLAVTLAAGSMHVFARKTGISGWLLGSTLLSTALASLHFTGMAAITIVPLIMNSQTGLSQLTMNSLAIATAVAGLLVIGCAAVSVVIDTHAHDETFRHLKRIATLDTLTGLPNRLSFDGELSRRLINSKLTSGFAVVMIDLSRFKNINDTYGHQAGDQLLIALAARFREILQPGQEFIARLGGDEFAILLPSAEMSDVSLRLERIAGTFKKPFDFHRFTTHTGANIGVSRAPMDGQDADTLLANADLAMYRAKQEHSPQPCFYAPSMDLAVRERRELANRLRAAIGTDDFHLHYQVQCAIQTREITGYEALCRWQGSDGRYISPAEFIPLAEEIGEIIRLGTWVLVQACRDAMMWPEPLTIAVNLSPLQLADASLISTVSRVLRETGLPPHRLELELTEGAIVHDRKRAMSQLTGLKALGITLALDDFGVGYSSLDILRTFPFDRIKLDNSFMADAVGNPQAIAILSSVALLGRKLGMAVLAEGVETVEQLDLVAREGCVSVQGYLLGRPSRHLADPEAIKRTMDAALPEHESSGASAGLLTDLRKRLLLSAT